MLISRGLLEKDRAADYVGLMQYLEVKKFRWQCISEKVGIISILLQVT